MTHGHQATRRHTGHDPSEQAADRAANEALAGPVRTPLLAARPWGTAHGTAQGTAQGPPLVGGQALPAPTRADMEARFGHSFADVRVHADGHAGRAAQALGAQAYTHGPHIVFGAGRLAPHTASGRQLLAHELAHVVQQRQPGAVQRTMLKPAAPTTVTAQPATDADKREFAQEALKFLRLQGEYFATLAVPRNPAKTLPLLRTSFNSGLQVLAGDTSAEALKLTAELRATYTEAVRSLLSALTAARPGATGTAPKLLDLYEQQRALIEPFAHPVDNARQELSAELEAPLPARPSVAQQQRHTAVQTARQRLQVLTTAVTMQVADLFGPQAGTAPALPARMSVRFASTVPAVLHKGLTGVVERMSHGVLEANSTLMLALDLQAFGGGNDAYRFTRLDLTQGRTTRIEVLVERQGAILSETMTAQERTQLRKHFDQAGFVRDSSFSDDAEFDQVLIGLAEMPLGQLSGLSGVRFLRAAAKAGHPNTGAEYESDTHTVTVFNHAYSASIARQGRAGRVIKAAAFTVAHEVGHAQDLSSLRTTATAFNTAQAAQMAEFSTGRGSFGIAGTAPAARRARYDQLDAARKAARTSQLDARSRSGARWQATGGSTRVTDVPPPRTATPAFRAAAALDDGPGARRMPTNYPNPDSFWREYYAECYALYFNSPDLLRRTQPHVFAHLLAEFPP